MKKFAFALALLAFVFLANAALTRYRVYSSGDILIQTGQGKTVADGLITNTFAIPFTTHPRVIVTQFGSAASTNSSVTTITLTNFIYSTAPVGSVSNNYVAIGTP